MIPLAVPDLSGNEEKYLRECIKSTYVSSVGPFVDRLESMIADMAGNVCGVATSSGTTALHTALMACGVQRGDIVIIPSFTFIATANAVAHCGAIPWLMDIAPDSWTLDPGKLREELRGNTTSRDGRLTHNATGRPVKAIVPVYTLGNIPDMDEIMTIAREYHLPVIADAAAAIGAEYRGRRCGTLADLTVFSFNGNKTVTAGGGGAITGDDGQRMRLAKHLSTTARASAAYDFDMVGYNYRMTNLQAAVGCAQLERADRLVEKKRYIRRRYRELLLGTPGVSFFPEGEGVRSACWFSGLVLEEGDPVILGEICGALRERGIEARTFWKPVHLQQPYAGALRSASLEVTDAIWGRILTLPCSASITDAELETVGEGLKQVLREVGVA